MIPHPLLKYKRAPTIIGRIAQSVERGANNASVLGLSPSVTTIIAPIAQLVERWSYEPEVEGSNPSGSTSVFSFFLRRGTQRHHTDDPHAGKGFGQGGFDAGDGVEEGREEEGVLFAGGGEEEIEEENGW